MALLSYAEEFGRAKPGVAFSNGYEGDSWMSLWCWDCKHFDLCPLVTVALVGRTPDAWEEREPSSLNRYTCHEFEQSEEKQS